MKIALLFIMLSCVFCAYTCEKDYSVEYFEENGHEYFIVTGWCRGRIQYTMHSGACPCGTGAYEVSNGK